MNWYDKFDTFIIWRQPLHLRPHTQANRIWLEWQDVPFPPHAYTPERLQKFDRIFIKSHYQRHLLPDEPDSKFVLVPNGCTPALLELEELPHEPYKLVYSSRYYRGLEHMLMYGWPIIHREVPQARLDVYYGFTRRDYGPERTPWREKMEALIANSPNVCDRGMVGYQELINQKRTAAIHYYGCTYEEIDCIAVRESAIVGCVPVTTSYAVLAEKDYCVKVPGDPLLPETQEALAWRIVELLKNQEDLASVREKCRIAAQADTWDRVARRWADEIEGVVAY